MSDTNSTALSLNMLDEYFGIDNIKSIPTPSFLYSQKRLMCNAEQMGLALANRNSSFYYAVKACYFPKMMSILKETGCRGVEIQSWLEYHLAKQAGFSEKEIIYNGPCKSRNDLLQASKKGIFINVDSPSELADLFDVCDDPFPNYGIRIDLPPKKEVFIGKGTKFGFSPEQIKSIFETKTASHKLPAGIHRHCLARCDSPEGIKLAYEPLAEWMGANADYVKKFRYINVGGGFDSSVRLSRNNISIEDLVRCAYESIYKLTHGATVIFEPGRFLVEDAAIAVTTVIRRKEKDQSSWLIVDIGTNILIPLPLARFEVLSLKRSTGGGRFSVGDGTCSPAGVIARNIPLPEIEEGDRLVVALCGAYTYSLAETFYSVIPPAYLVNNNHELVPMLTLNDSNNVARSLYHISLDD